MRRRRLFALGAALALALGGCGGWEPLYADNEASAGAEGLREIKVNPIAERVGQQLEMALRTSFNPNHEPAKQAYVLNVILQKALLDSGIQSQGLGTRGEVHIYAKYTLTEIGTNKVLQIGNIHTDDTFDIQANGYSTVVAQNDAETRDVEDLRREIVTRMTLFMQNRTRAAAS